VQNFVIAFVELHEVFPHLLSL